MLKHKYKKNIALVNILEKHKKCKRSSCRTYASVLMRIHREFSKKKFNTNMKWLSEDASVILNKIKKLQNVNIQRNLVGTGLVGLSVVADKKNQDIWNKYLKELNAKKAEMMKSGELTGKQKSAWVDWKEIVKLRKMLNRRVNLTKLYEREFNKTDFLVLQRLLILSLLTMLPGVARRDYATLKFITKKKFEQLKDQSGENYVVTGSSFKILFQKYKTSSTYGAVNIPVAQHSKPLQRLLKKHIQFLKRNFPENDCLFLNRTLVCMSRNSLTKFLQRLFKEYFKKNVSVTMLRHIFLTDKYDKKQLEEQSETAKFMMHSRSMMQDYVKKRP
jgi:hypothetical protein